MVRHWQSARHVEAAASLGWVTVNSYPCQLSPCQLVPMSTRTTNRGQLVPQVMSTRTTSDVNSYPTSQVSDDGTS